LGGSVVTEKDKPLTPDRENIKRLSREIAEAGEKELILVHGGGSYGHPIADKYNLSKGYFDVSQIIGVAKTHQAMVALNSLLIESLLSYSVPAISVAPSSFIITDKGRIMDMNLSNLRHYLEKGITSVSYGDVVPDRSRGFSILSGDQLAARFALELGADRLIYGIDVDGVYTSNPKLDRNARLVELLSLKDIEENIRLGGPLSTDVTGGMKGKIQEAVNALSVGIQVQIVNASKPDIIFKALRGERVTGTLLVK